MSSAFAGEVELYLPPVFGLKERVNKAELAELAVPAAKIRGRISAFSRGKIIRYRFSPVGDIGDILLIENPTSTNLEFEHAVLIDGRQRLPKLAQVDGISWLRHPQQDSLANVPRAELINQIRASWTNQFHYIEENLARGQKGLRRPQIGALHAIHARWTVSDATATIVMPTGTGKTETMLATLVSAQCERVLVVVPTDVLRSQVAQKFLSLGMLADPDAGILGTGVRRPIVAMLRHIPTTVRELDEIFLASQVIITTSAIAGRAPPVIQERMAFHCSHLFIDEAHHSEAPTWASFKAHFRDRRILQFTATPFREDGKPLDGDIIFKYPLRKAQQEGYFSAISFARVVEFNPKQADAAIAARAVAQLRADFAKGHILMARVDSVERASEVYKLYEPYAEFRPVQLHSGIKSAPQRSAIRQQILSGKSRIVVCVDMLGEGFDLPELKIAAFHDIRKGLAITLQLAGRFTRSRQDLGCPTFIANTADIVVQDELRKLYARDPDWNVLLGELSERLINEQRSLQEFLNGFTEFAEEIPLNTVRIAASAVVYRTTCSDWTPESFRRGIPSIASCGQIHSSVNEAKKTLVVVTARRVEVSWTDVESISGWQWELYVAHWSSTQNLLFINSSTNAGEFRALAEALVGPDAALISGQDVFRTFAGTSRLRLQQVGLSEVLGRNIRYIGHMGSNVEPAIPEARRAHTRKAVISGTGFSSGAKVTLGASRKGRVWSFRRETLDGYLRWCHDVGDKLLDQTIDPDAVLRGTLRSTAIAARPDGYPIGIDWPEEIYRLPEVAWTISTSTQFWLLSEVSLELIGPSITGPLTFGITAENDRIELTLEVFEENERPNYRFVVSGKSDVVISHGDRSTAQEVAQFFYENPPVFWFADGSLLEGNQHVELRQLRAPYDSTKAEIWDWAGVDIQVESQGDSKNPRSIQARVIRELKSRDYAVIFDDDGAGEVADVVAIKVLGDETWPDAIEVELYHCKYSLEPTAGARIEDLYEVCGQAQKCVSWMISGEKQTDLVTHLLRRNARRDDQGRPSRLEVGTVDQLEIIREMTRMRPITVKVFIVQPGVSKERLSDSQLRLLSVTETYLLETYQLPLGVIVSA